MLAAAGLWRAAAVMTRPAPARGEATAARPRLQWWHYRQCAEDRGGGHTASPHLTSPPQQPPVVTLVRPRLVREVVQWQWVKSDSEPIFLPVYLSQIFPKFTKGFKTFQPFEVDILLLVKAEPISQIVCIQRIRSSFEPGASPGQSPALVQTCKRCYIYTIFGEGS